ncbi:MAG: hypothetical protein R3330_01630, partial [Saprospiraceae bacterium]|nr:hypothetical protein [Saprospiraceae bacterium]
MKDLLVIYHGNCADGFGAAWVVWNALGPEVEFFPGTYQSAPPDCTDRNVLMVDFSYKRPVIDMIAQVARSIVILDHHKSAKEDLEPFAVQECGEGRLAWADIPSMLRDLEELNRPPILALFDMERSGAMITWDVFNPGQKPPQLLRHIQDRDLWRFELEGTREIQAALFSYPYDFRTWD